MPEHLPESENLVDDLPVSSPMDVYVGATETGLVETDVLHELDPDQVADEKVRKRLGIGFWIASGWMAFITFIAVFAPVLPFQDPNALATDAAPFAAPSSAHWLGTDSLGRDMLARLAYGARVSLSVGVAAIMLSLIVGGIVGLIAGYFKGRTETVLMGAMDVLLAFPALLLALSIITFTESRQVLWVQLGHSVGTIAFAIGIVGIAPLARLVRASTLVFAEREFVLASRTLGASNRRIVFREILPNVMLPVLSFAIIGVAVAIVAEGGLAFLGLSVAPPQATWGGMINEGRNYLSTYPWVSLLPCLVLFLTVLSLNLAGDRVREYFDVKEGAL
jgi:peptide/nickel transport system permease protein